MLHLVRALGWGLIVGALVLVSRLSLNGQEKSDVLKYTIRSVPGGSAGRQDARAASSTFISGDIYVYRQQPGSDGLCRRRSLMPDI